MVQVAEDADLAELGDTGDEYELQVFIIAFQRAEEALEDCLVVLLQFVVIQHLNQWFVIFIHQHHTFLAGLFPGGKQKIPEALWQRKSAISSIYLLPSSQML